MVSIRLFDNFRLYRVDSKFDKFKNLYKFFGYNLLHLYNIILKVYLLVCY